MKKELHFRKILKNILLITLISFQSFFYSQKSIDNHSIILKTNPTALIDVFTFPTVQFAVEKKINNYFSLQTEFGIQMFDFNYKSDTIIVKVGGFKINAEARFYPFKYFKENESLKRGSDGLFAGIQPFYRENKYTASTQYLLSENDTINFIDYYGVSKKNYGINVTFGYQKLFLRRFIFEPYLSIGYHYRDVINSKREYNINKGHIENNGPHDFFGNSNKAEYSGYNVNFALAFRIGYQF